MSTSKIFLFMGPPGSGKGTLSSLCVKHFGWKQLSTGNLCREHIQKETPIGKQIQSAIESGKLVSDEVIADMVKGWLLSESKHSKDIIFDGYPRTKKQAEILYKLLDDFSGGFTLNLVKLDVEDDLLIDRILSRASCSNKSCQQVYSLLDGSSRKPKKNMICDSCNSDLIIRTDDTKEALKNRIELYHQNEQPIIDYFVDKGIEVQTLNAAQEIEQVFNDFIKLAE